MISDIRKGRDHLTSWIHPAIKKELEAYFRNDEGFKRRYLMNVANRVSVKSSKYTGGLATFMKTKSKLSKLLDREATLAEIFKYSHTLKANKERFVTKQSQPPIENDKAGSKTSVVDPYRVWRETASQPHKNSRFKMGSFFTSGLCSSSLATSSTSDFATSPTDPQEVVNLREKVQKLE
ncbi:hypothetical protein Ahy_A05g022934 [Arachis hypogaea]|uniref:Uncharacterized protein n=1 Tax=Arachis hypogaea TaxID=3818 RepID=A0A445D1X1_ARAHY|nr:hypothetical protein Ahy_A05g022934 [Arachis hypogaea]